MKVDDQQRILYSPSEFAGLCGISKSLLYKLWREGEGPPYAKLKERRIIPRESGLEWARSLTLPTKE